MTENLTLWHQVERTDPSQVKAITGKPYKGTSPKPYYLVQKATEIFGPCGLGWGYEIVSQQVVTGAGDDKVHVAHIRLWYKWNGEKCFVEHVGQTMFCGKRESGKFYTDEDAPKKSVTDAMVKALSMIGFAGDIFMGRYDDSKYVADLQAEFREEVVIPADQKADTIKAYIAVFKEAVSHAQTVEELRPMWKEGDYARGKLGIVPASTVYGDLYALWVARGKELSAAHNIVREAAE